MPLLKPPEPTVAKRKYYIRLDEPLAVTMERYAEFIGAHTADHVISQALEFVFKKDSDFREWLEKNPMRGSERQMQPDAESQQKRPIPPTDRRPYDSARPRFKGSGGLCTRLRNRADCLFSMALPRR
jgi:hypothetical protein